MQGFDIKAYLDQRNITQKHVAEKAGISVVTFNEIMHNKRKLTANEYIRIYKAISVPMETFFKLV